MTTIKEPLFQIKTMTEKKYNKQRNGENIGISLLQRVLRFEQKQPIV